MGNNVVTNGLAGVGSKSMVPFVEDPRTQEWVDYPYMSLGKIIRGEETSDFGPIQKIVNPSGHPSELFMYAVADRNSILENLGDFYLSFGKDGAKKVRVGYYDPSRGDWDVGKPSIHITGPIEGEWKPENVRDLNLKRYRDELQQVVEEDMDAYFTFFSRRNGVPIHQVRIEKTWVPVPIITSLSYSTYHGTDFFGRSHLGEPISGSFDRLKKFLTNEEINNIISSLDKDGNVPDGTILEL